MIFDINKVSRNQLIKSMKEGYDWEVRCSIMRYLVATVLENNPKHIFRNGDLCRTILKEYEVEACRGDDIYKALQNCISKIGKEGSMKQYVRLGKTMRTGTRRGGKPVYTRERLWALNENSMYRCKKHRKEGEEGEKLKEAMRLVSEAGYYLIRDSELIEGCQGILETHGYKVAYLEDVNEVDNREISRYAKNGFAKETCGNCGGAGSIYVRKL